MRDETGDVASVCSGFRGEAMLEALLHGTTDAETRAELSRGRLRQKLPSTSPSPQHRSAHHRFFVGRIIAHLDYHPKDESSAECRSETVEHAAAPFLLGFLRLKNDSRRTQRTGEVIILECGLDCRRFRPCTPG